MPKDCLTYDQTDVEATGQHVPCLTLLRLHFNSHIVIYVIYIMHMYH